MTVRAKTIEASTTSTALTDTNEDHELAELTAEVLPRCNDGNDDIRFHDIPRYTEVARSIDAARFGARIGPLWPPTCARTARASASSTPRTSLSLNG